ncbi:MAG: hypothetical protein LAO20_18095 [Acidobacteriia bacterium]|nr:hypothetical protein [Terriglobia bacterium]
MQSLLRDVLLSFCPERIRRDWRAESPPVVLRAAIWTGLLQFLLFAYLLAVRYWHFASGRTRLWAPQTAHASETVQSGVLIIITLEFFLYPLSFLLLYFCLEGAARFFTALIGSEVVPSLPVTLFFSARDRLRRRHETQRLSSLPPDIATQLPDGRWRIATAHARPSWSNPSLTIGIAGEHYELERMDRGPLPHPFIYFLRRAPVGKILRGYEEYDAPNLSPRD